MLEASHKSYILKHFIIASALINALLNGAIGYGLFAGSAEITLWGQPSLGGDIIATVFFLTLITSLLVNKGVELALSYNRIPPVAVSAAWLARINRLPDGTWPKALLFSLLAVLIIAPTTLYALHVLGVQALSPESAIVFKALFSAAVGLLLTPLIGLLALLSHSRESDKTSADH